MAKQYGLIIPNKKAGGIPIQRPSIFDEDSDSDEPKVLKPTGISKAKKQDTINQQKALGEDPTVFQYDEIYDEMENKQKELLLSKKDVEKKPKYINKLLAAAETRKRENERRIERQVQKEREAEGEEFKDKESFVTSGYKKKLEEMRALEEQEKREEYLEAIGDVTKQGNLDGFYRHIYDQKVNYEDRLKDESKVKEESKSDSEDQPKKRPLSSSDDNSDSEGDDKVIRKKPGVKQRKYRSRKDSKTDDKTDSESENVEVRKEHLPSNLDADSDFSVDSSSDEENQEPESKDDTIEHKGEKFQLPAKGNVLSDNAALSKKSDEKGSEDEGNNAKSINEKPSEEQPVKEEEKPPKKPKIDIWRKRTIGAVFDEAVKRYFERKAARGW